MNEFAQLLGNLLKKKRISIKRAAENLGIDRATLRRYIKGEYVPADADILLRFENAFQLTDIEYNDLLNSFLIQKYGRKYYEGLKLFDNLSRILRFSGCDTNENAEMPDEAATENKSCYLLESETEIKYYLTKYFRNSDQLRMISNLGDGACEMFDQLGIREIVGTAKEVYHIFCMSSNLSKECTNDVTIFENLLKLYSSCNLGTIHYIVNSTDSPVLKNYIMTDRYVLEFYYVNHNGARNMGGVFIQKSEIAACYHQYFEQQKNVSSAYGCILESQTDLEDMHVQIIDSMGSDDSLQLNLASDDHGDFMQISCCNGRKHCIKIYERVMCSIAKLYIHEYQKLRKREKEDPM